MHTLSNPDIKFVPDADFYDQLVETMADLSSQQQQFLMGWKFDCLSPKEAAVKAGYKASSEAALRFMRDPDMLRAGDMLVEKLRREHGAVTGDWVIRKYRFMLDGAIEDRQWAAARGILADIAKHSGVAPEDKLTVEHTGKIEHGLAGIDPNDLKAVAVLHEQIARMKIQEKEIGPNAQRSGNTEATLTSVPTPTGTATGTS